MPSLPNVMFVEGDILDEVKLNPRPGREREAQGDDLEGPEAR